MSRKKIFVKTKGAEGLARTTRRLQDMGFSILPGHYAKGDGHTFEWADIVSSQLRCGTPNTDSDRRQIPLLYASSGNEQPVVGVGTEGLGWMEWGAGNRLPNVVSILTLMLPYPAAAWKFNTDLVSALGPRAKYRYTQYVGGNITAKSIPYGDAGALLKGQIVDLMKQLVNVRKEEREYLVGQQSDANDGNDEGMQILGEITVQENNNGQSPYADLIVELEEQLSQLRADYDEWKRVVEEYRQFLKNNNLTQTFLELFGDEEMMGMCFPELLLNAQQIDDNGKPVKTRLWTPKIVGIRARRAHTCRLERMDKQNRINYVYVSNRWYDTPVVDMSQAVDEIGAIPALNVNSPTEDIERIVREAREKNVTADKRPTHFIMPSYYPTPGRPYYPMTPWHSIFGGDIYEFAATIISDRFTRRRNSNVIGRVIYINNDYLQSLYLQRGADTPEQKDALRDKIFEEINSWLRNRGNSGQSLVAFTFTGSDGNEHESFKIVEIESASKNTAEANQKELSEISSVIFFAMGLDSRLVGNTPGNESSSGGTDLRERYLLKQIQKGSTQKMVLKILDVVRDFNNWDPKHLVWEIDREVLTTLDNSKTGITMQESN